MSEPPDDHTLNACLARVIGVEIVEGKSNNDIVWFLTEEWAEEDLDEFTEWNPIKNANQMELIENHFVEAVKQYEFYTAWCPAKGLWEAFLSEYGRACRPIFHPDKKRAFALAVYAMEQSQSKDQHAR